MLNYFVLDCPTLSYYKEATLAYIGGFIVGKLLKSLSCEECSGALVTNDKTIGFLSLVKFTDRGGIIYPSAHVLKILKVCEICSEQIFLVITLRNLK